MKHIKKIITLVTMGILICGSSLTAPVSNATDNQPFFDVSSKFWGAAAIGWAYDKKIVEGYPDGSFKPDQRVSESEFLAMLIRAYAPADLSQDENGSWDSAYTTYAIMNRWIDSGWRIGDPPLDPSVVARGKVAKILTHASGRNYNRNDSIAYLLDSGLAQGKTDRSINGYHQDETLTRAEAVTFVQNVKSKLDILYASPSVEETYAKESLSLTPAENWKLIVAQGLEGPEFLYSMD